MGGEDTGKIDTRTWWVLGSVACMHTKREYLKDLQTRDLMKNLNAFFESNVGIPRIKVGYRQIIETLISEEALLFAKFLRGERRTWTPRLGMIGLFKEQ